MTNSDLFWIQDSPAKKHFIERIQTIDENLFTKMMKCSQVIKEYWDEEYFTEKELSEQLLCICEKCYDDNFHMGIMVKKEPNTNQYTVTVRGILGNFKCVPSDNKKDYKFVIEDNSENFTLSKTYNSFPTKKELIDDFISLDLLENTIPIDYINNTPVFLTSKEYFNEK